MWILIGMISIEGELAVIITEGMRTDYNEIWQITTKIDQFPLYEVKNAGNLIYCLNKSRVINAI